MAASPAPFVSHLACSALALALISKRRCGKRMRDDLLARLKQSEHEPKDTGHPYAQFGKDDHLARFPIQSAQILWCLHDFARGCIGACGCLDRCVVERILVVDGVRVDDGCSDEVFGQRGLRFSTAQPDVSVGHLHQDAQKSSPFSQMHDNDRRGVDRSPIDYRMSFAGPTSRSVTSGLTRLVLLLERTQPRSLWLLQDLQHVHPETYERCILSSMNVMW